MSSHIMGSDLRPISEYIENSIAPSTLAGYQSAWLFWLSFLNSIRAPAGSFLESLVLLFLNGLFEKGYSWSYVQRTLSGISFFLKLKNLPSCLQFFSVRQALKGYKKKNFTWDKRKPITPVVLGDLCSITEQVCFSVFEAILFKAFFSVSFFGAFRVSELFFIQVNDIILSDSLLRIFIRKSKTDQLGKGIWITLYACSSSPVCPVWLMKAYCSVRPFMYDKFFIHESGSPLTRYQFNWVFKRCLERLNLQNSHLTSHSFRIGAATEAARLGLDSELIKKVGRWKSNSYLLYIRPNQSF